MSTTIATVTRDASNNKFVCTINGQSIGTSKYEDYFEYHYKRGDIARLNSLNIDQFAYLNDDGTVKVTKDAVKAAPKDKPAEAAPTEIKVEGVHPADGMDLAQAEQ
jgi:hypothetical protein